MAKRPPITEVRLNKYISECGLASRRKADEWIQDGKVQLNGKTVYELGVRVQPGKDRIVVNGKPLKPQTKKHLYIAFYKPKHVMTTLSDPEGRPTVRDFFPKVRERIFPVGRLDWDTEGLLLMTTDGDFAQSVIHPSKEIPKTYLAKLDGQPTEAQLQKLRTGVSIIGGRVKAMYIERVKRGSEQYDWVRISVAEGKNRQVRRMFEKIGFDVKKLQRVAIGSLKIGSLERGEIMMLGPRELERIFIAPKELRK
ncbi:MAG: rRNA pseudouridine synthase, partial [Bdellovibrionales bacterium]|nr:rRNA pseudouridine synthase [Bdellovibrionales bacterium]